MPARIDVEASKCRPSWLERATGATRVCGHRRQSWGVRGAQPPDFGQGVVGGGGRGVSWGVGGGAERFWGERRNVGGVGGAHPPSLGEGVGGGGPKGESGGDRGRVVKYYYI